jgi:cyclopropane-fatty-acyl-phospholipid synthase
MRDFDAGNRFDRVISVEMFEHMRNYELLFERVSNWLEADGKAFVHVFCHRTSPYLFEDNGAADWMGRHFFTGGIMPSQDLFSHFSKHLEIEQHWSVNGLHYWRTCEEWLRNLDRNRAALLERFRQDVSVREAKIVLQRWRIFFMACAELFRYLGGTEWFVAHYMFRRAAVQSPTKNSQQVQTAV